MRMLARGGVGQVSPLEIVLAIALLLAVTFLAAWLAARLYRYGVLYDGQWRKIWQVLCEPDQA
jgi:hypothetical protein